MAHAILGKRFFNRDDMPAWHGLGKNVGKDARRTAREAIVDVGGLYSVEKRRIFIEVNGSKIESDYNFIVREALADDPTERILGEPVHDNYEIITPEQAIDLYDRNVLTRNGETAPVETLGVLSKGARIFITTRLPRVLNIQGDEVNTYLLYDNPIARGDALGVYTTGVRVVCQNTLLAGVDHAIERRTIPHTRGATKAIADWLQGIYGRALTATQGLEAAYTKLAKTPISDTTAKDVLDTVYALPKEPSLSDRATRSLEERMNSYARECIRMESTRKLAFGLYSGDGMGMDTRAVKGTAFGLYNAVAEIEDNRKARSVEALVAGDRAARIRQAFALCLEADRKVFA